MVPKFTWLKPLCAIDRRLFIIAIQFLWRVNISDYSVESDSCGYHGILTICPTWLFWNITRPSKIWKAIANWWQVITWVKWAKRHRLQMVWQFQKHSARIPIMLTVFWENWFAKVRDLKRELSFSLCWFIILKVWAMNRYHLPKT